MSFVKDLCDFLAQILLQPQPVPVRISNGDNRQQPAQQRPRR